MRLSPARPFLVVTTITPAIARAPYMEVAEPSFRMLKLSMSSAFRPAMAELISVVASPEESASASMSITSSIMTPSTTQRGFELPKIDVAPRTRILGAVPNVPDTFCTETPAERPSRPRLISAIPESFTSSAERRSAAPVKSRLSVLVIPVTTTDSIVCSSGTRVICMFGRIFTSCVTYPK